MVITMTILGKVSRGISRTVSVGFCEAEFGPFGRLVDRAPWEAVLRG